jgi:hypothetical protein
MFSSNLIELLILHILHISGVHVVTVICFHVFSSVSWCPLVEQELPTLPENMSSPLIFSEVRVARSLLFSVVFCRSLFVLLSFFIWSLCYLFFFDLRILITWIYNYLCNQCPSPLMFESRSWRGVLDTTLCDEVWQWKWQCVCLQHMPTFWNIYFKERQQTCYTRCLYNN